MSRWTKVDLRTLRSQIDAFVLFRGLYHDADVLRRVIERDRSGIALSGLRSFRATIAERAVTERGTSEHFAANPGIYGDSTPEMVTRFADLADGDDRAVEKLDRLVERVEREGLPPEVADYLPDSLR